MQDCRAWSLSGDPPHSTAPPHNTSLTHCPTSGCISHVIPTFRLPNLCYLASPLLPAQHPAGDLSLLATAATESSAALEPPGPAATTVGAPPGSSWGPATSTGGAPVGSWGPAATSGGAPPGPGVKRRKTAPRKLGSYLVSSGLLPRGPYRSDRAGDELN